MVFEEGGARGVIFVFLQKLVLLLSLSSQMIYQFILVTSTIYDLHVSDSRHTELSAKTYPYVDLIVQFRGYAL